jgi:hypothetical protein
MATAVSCHPAAATWWPHSQQRQSQITQQLENILLLMQFYINNIRKISLFMMMTCSTRRWPPVPGCGRGRTAEHWCAPPPLPRVLRTILPIAASGHVRGASMATDAMSGDQHPAEWPRDISCLSLHLSLRCAVCCYCYCAPIFIYTF